MSENIEHLAKQNMLPLFLRMSIPIAISLMVAGLYNVIDTIFIARGLGANAMGGVSMVFPIQMAVAALAALLSTGMASLMARLNGAKDYAASANIARLSLIVSAFFTIALMFVAWFWIDDILIMLAVSDELALYAYDYISPILAASASSMFLPVIADIFRAEGRMMTMMAMILSASLINIALDPLFIFVFGWGVSGAAWATVCAQIIAIGIGSYVYCKNPPLSDIRKSTHTQWRTLPLLLGLGLPIFVAQLSTGVQSGAVNYFLQTLGGESGDVWVSSFGILGRLFTFVFLPLIAMMIAFQTIAGFNMGAKNVERVAASIRVSFVVMFVYCVLQVLSIVSFPEFWIGLFIQNDAILSTSKTIINITLWSFPTASVFMIATGFYQAKGDAIPAIIMSGLRVFIVLIPLLFILPEFMGFIGIIWALPIADIIAAFVALIICGAHFTIKRRTIQSKGTI